MDREEIGEMPSVKSWIYFMQITKGLHSSGESNRR